MSCVSDNATFRLLDGLVGWDPAAVQGLEGLDTTDGVTLKIIAGTGTVTEAEVVDRLLPAQLAHGCGPCEWYLVTPYPPRSRLLRLDPCTGGWRDVWSDSCTPDTLYDALAIAVHRDRIGIIDRKDNMFWLYRHRGEQLVAAVPLRRPGPIAHAPWGEWLIVDPDAKELRRFDPAGGARGRITAELPGPVDRVSVDAKCRIWLATTNATGYLLWLAGRDDKNFRPASMDELHDAFPPTGIAALSEAGFCFKVGAVAGPDKGSCYSWYGRPLEIPLEPPEPPKRFANRGQLLTGAIDSGIPRCRWHRVRIDADVPAGTTVSVAVSSHEEANPDPQGRITDPPWQGFAPGIPHPSDWQIGPAGMLDFLIDQPPGRYLFLRMRLVGDGHLTPRVRRIRTDFPRQTSLENLPAVYRENPDAENFTERFLSIFDAFIEDIDRTIERYPALLDVDNVPGDVLPWLGSFLDLAMDPAWDANRRRRILKHLPKLYRKRGTASGLRKAVRLVFDFDPVIQELAYERNWGAVGRARVRNVRLFGPARVRCQVGRSALNAAPLHSFGRPERDPFTTGAHRFRLLLPGLVSSHEQQRLTHLIESQKPAHTVAAIRAGGQGVVLGGGIAVGIDTSLTPLPPPVLGGAKLRLRRSAVLWAGSRGRRSGPAVGQTTVVGINTVME
jgi:phage tail-like protein